MTVLASIRTAVKRLVKAVAPRAALMLVDKIRRRIHSIQNSRRTAEQVFSAIYREAKWGIAPPTSGTPRPFHSGSGSASESVVRPYVEVISEHLRTYPTKPRIVDLGCGDFKVGRNFVDYCSKYVGVDVVPVLVSHLQETFQRNHVSFVCVDITSDAPLPDGDVCFVRQVLQHLSNKQILTVLLKLRQYECVYLTEHYPSGNEDVVRNRDKVHGADIRLYDNSGVYLDSPPFNVPSSSLTLLLEGPGTDLGDLYDGGVIRTYLLKW